MVKCKVLRGVIINKEARQPGDVIELQEALASYLINIHAVKIDEEDKEVERIENNKEMEVVEENKADQKKDKKSRAK